VPALQPTQRFAAITPYTLRLYHSPSSPNSRRVRILLAEKGLKIPLVAVDLGKGEQHSEAYRAINPPRVVLTLVLENGTAIGEVPAIMRYLDEAFPEQLLLGATPNEKGLIAMWKRRAELEGFAAMMERVRNKIPGLKGRAIAGPHDYEQIPALVERSMLRVKNFFSHWAWAGSAGRRAAVGSFPSDTRIDSTYESAIDQ